MKLSIISGKKQGKKNTLFLKCFFFGVIFFLMTLSQKKLSFLLAHSKTAFFE